MIIAYRSMHCHPQRFLSCARLPGFILRCQPLFPLHSLQTTYSQNYTLHFVFVLLYSIVLMSSTICTKPRTSQTSCPLFGIYLRYACTVPYFLDNLFTLLDTFALRMWWRETFIWTEKNWEDILRPEKKLRYLVKLCLEDSAADLTFHIDHRQSSINFP
jgi:hypothetical protein